MKIQAKDLIQKVQDLDARILGLWVDDNIEMQDEEKWELFAVLLETRVELLKSVRDAGLKLEPETILPNWLKRFSRTYQDLRLRDIKQMYEEVDTRKKLKVFESVADMKGEE